MDVVTEADVVSGDTEIQQCSRCGWQMAYPMATRATFLFCSQECLEWWEVGHGLRKYSMRSRLLSAEVQI